MLDWSPEDTNHNCWHTASLCRLVIVTCAVGQRQSLMNICAGAILTTIQLLYAGHRLCSRLIPAFRFARGKQGKELVESTSQTGTPPATYKRIPFAKRTTLLKFWPLAMGSGSVLKVLRHVQIVV